MIGCCPLVVAFSYIKCSVVNDIYIAFCYPSEKLRLFGERFLNYVDFVIDVADEILC